MTPAADPTPPPVRRRWGLFAPTALLLAVCAAWSAGWSWAAGKAGETVETLLAREAARGRVYACGERRIGGYPFRIEVDCLNATVRIPLDGGVAVAGAPRFLAVAQVYDPRKLIGELTGPVEATGPDGTRATLSFGSARASAAIDGRRLDRGSVAVETPRLIVGETDIGAAASLQGHLRKSPDAGDGVYDAAVSIEGGVSPAFDLLPLGRGPVALELQVQASGVDDLRPGPVEERLKAFAAAGGRLRVVLAKALRGDVAAEATGELSLDAEGRLNGALDVTARGFDGMVDAAVGVKGDGAMSTLLGMGTKLLGKPVELDGRPATRYRLKLDKGKVSLGPIKLTRLPPAF